jgi:hypothetical protein
MVLRKDLSSMNRTEISKILENAPIGEIVQIRTENVDGGDAFIFKKLDKDLWDDLNDERTFLKSVGDDFLVAFIQAVRDIDWRIIHSDYDWEKNPENELPLWDWVNEINQW